MPIDAAHIHLMLNHVPVIGAPFLLLLLGIGLARGSRELVTVSLALVVGLALATGLVYLTGEPAEELVEHAPWFRDSLLKTHEEQAMIALVAMLVTGALAGVAIALRNRQGPGAWLPRVVWGGLAVSVALLGWVSWSGGQIRHDELRSQTSARATAASLRHALTSRSVDLPADSPQRPRALRQRAAGSHGPLGQEPAQA